MNDRWEMYDEVSGTWIKSPKAIVDETDTIHTFVKELEDKIMSASSPADDDFRSSFLAFYKEWLRWREEHKYGNIWGKFGSWGPFWDKLMEYKQRANEWLTRYKNIGGVTVLSVLPEKKKETSLLKVALYGGLILGGVFVASKVYGQLKDPLRGG